MPDWNQFKSELLNDFQEYMLPGKKPVRGNALFVIPSLGSSYFQPVEFPSQVPRSAEEEGANLELYTRK